MAYRQLCAVTFVVLGLAAVGCGGDTASAGSSGSGSAGDQPPGNAEQPRNSAVDQAPASPYQPPANADAPPSGGGTPAGAGQLTDVCEELCSTLATEFKQCDLNKTLGGMGQLCSDQVRCKIPANLPCQAEISRALACVLDNVARVCAPNANDNLADSTCQVESKAVTTCSKAQDAVGDAGNCTNAGDCKCPDACTKCTCKASGDLAGLQACLQGACATP